ncbi:hypothetical protein QBC35DRAFT_395284 [Podospora australis]|uniref:Secreted protein n=1 Tax=Podospora australis TaxID=1536484 RepID=A0AAN6WJY5_9PEZI|nr:hypothetical protein QBC35DRAFT_395284 [Podospora australis]
MKLFTLALPALAAAASIQPLQSRQVAGGPRVVYAAQLGNPNGCPAGTFSFALSEGGLIGTIIFDAYNALVGPGISTGEREKQCDFDVTIEFPIGCTTGNIIVHPRGDNFIANTDTGVYSASYTLPKGQLPAGNPPNIQYRSGQNFAAFQSIPASINIRNQNERNTTFTARTRIFLETPLSNPQYSEFSIQNMDIYVRDVVTTPTC